MAAKKQKTPKPIDYSKMSLEQLLKMRKEGKGDAGLGKAIAQARTRTASTPADAGGGVDPSTGETPEEKTKNDQTIVRTRDIAKEATDYGASFADRYVPAGTFRKLKEGSSQEMLGHLERLRQRALTDGNYTDYESAALEAMKAGLGGYSSPELQAQTESMKAQGAQDLRTQLRMQELSAARNRVRGAAATAGAQGLQKQSLQANANINRDIFIKNADEMQRRKEAFGDLVNRTETARYGRDKDSNTLYGSTLGGEESTQRAVSQFNIGQDVNEALARSSASLAGSGVFSGLYGGEQSASLTSDYIKSATEQANRQFDLLQKELDRNNSAANG